MRAVIQRVTQSAVTIDDRVVAGIQTGLLVLIGVGRNDRPQDAEYLADKIVHLRIFADKQDKMNLSLLDIGGEMLVVSQFTLLANCRKGRRPSFIDAADPATADRLYRHFVNCIRARNIAVQTGRFQAMMTVSLDNNGPVTLVLESKPS